MNRVEQAKLSRFYMRLLEYFENRENGENTVTSLLAEYVELSEKFQNIARAFIARARYFVVGERDGTLSAVERRHMEEFAHILEEKVLSLQGER